MTQEDLLEAAKKYELAYKGDIEDGAVLLGQSIGIINNIQYIPDIIDTIVRDAEKYLKNAYTFLK